MSRPTQRWGSNDQQGRDDGYEECAGSSSREWRTRQAWMPQHRSQPQQRDAPATSSWQGTERQQRWWHRDADTTLCQSDARPLRQQQPLRSAEVSFSSASVLPWRNRNEFAEQQRKSPRSSWHTRERDVRGSQSSHEPFAQQRRVGPTRAWPDTHERTAAGRARQERAQIYRRPRDWDDAQLSPRPTRHIDERRPVGKLLSGGANAVHQSRPWRQVGARNTSHDSKIKESDFQRDGHHKLRSAGDFVQEREPAENIVERTTFSGRGTFTSSTRQAMTDNRVATRPWATNANNAQHRADHNDRFVWSSGSRIRVVVDATPSTQATRDNDRDASSDYEGNDDLGDDSDRVVLDHIDDRDSHTRRQLVLGKRKAVDGTSRNGFVRRELIAVAASEKAKVKQHAKACMVGGCKSLVRSKGVCKAHGGGKRCQYPDGCDKSAIDKTTFCIAHGGGKRCQYPDGCDKSAIGKTMLCKAHGGGKRCQYPDGCDKGARGSTLFCNAHGGGKRCQYPDGCGKGAEGRTLFCIAHGGGKRCQYPDGCDKGARGSTLFCNAHGGGKRCQYLEGCDKSAIYKTTFCVAHGGGKRCQYPEGCDKGAVGQTMFCVAHGGGRRCQYPDGCGRGALGPTSFCKAHGGGRRCIHSSGCNKHVVKRGMCNEHGVAAGLWT